MDYKKALQKYPRLCAHVIAESLGYASPVLAARIVTAAANGEPFRCEWLYACFAGEARRAVEAAIAHRHSHRGYMASYKQAKALIDAVAANDCQQPPELSFGSWF